MFEQDCENLHTVAMQLKWNANVPAVTLELLDDVIASLQNVRDVLHTHSVMVECSHDNGFDENIPF